MSPIRGYSCDYVLMDDVVDDRSGIWPHDFLRDINGRAPTCDRNAAASRSVRVSPGRIIIQGWPYPWPRESALRRLRTVRRDLSGVRRWPLEPPHARHRLPVSAAALAVVACSPPPTPLFRPWPVPVEVHRLEHDYALVHGIIAAARGGDGHA